MVNLLMLQRVLSRLSKRKITHTVKVRGKKITTSFKKK